MENLATLKILPKHIWENIQPENFTRSIDFSDRSSAVLFGDGSAAAVLSATVKARAAFVQSSCRTNARRWERVTIPPGGHFRQDGHAVQGFAIRRMTESVRSLRSVPETGGFFRFIGHQANLGALRTVCERAGIKDAEHWYNVDEFGNTGCAGAPSVLGPRPGPATRSRLRAQVAAATRPGPRLLLGG